MTGASCGVEDDSVFVYRELTLDQAAYVSDHKDTNDLTTVSKGYNRRLYACSIERYHSLIIIIIGTARAILQDAYAAIPYSEEICIAAFKLEFENHELERARMPLAKVRERVGMRMKSAIVERESENMH
ncbi:hypothetical protein RHSIM_Rhsim05G0039100 [Rhododendron simsii]|uniref:Uncharacterized protein n=1 Tax=Rhododendron simsii TaxID=118357 RepID=A0A834GZX5_RHOSS|nr:hypothetical protein RHSIM_Rhsim05G0039100 [Rhododendron simsii]